MTKILIADSGSTKIQFALVSKAGFRKDFQTEGLNPLVHSVKEMYAVINEAFVKLKEYEMPEQIFFYGAGYSTDSAKLKLKDVFDQTAFSGTNIILEHDLLGAARSLFQKKEGIACILGTGSNSAMYKDGLITDNVPALGYVLGDDGGGLDMGRRFLRGIFKRQAPSEIIERFNEKYHMDVSNILDSVYTQERPNKFIASFSHFLSENISHDYCEGIVRSSLASFLSLDVLSYKENDLPVGFVGSIAHVFRDILREIVEKQNLKLGEILKDPMEGLIRYHMDFSDKS